VYNSLDFFQSAVALLFRSQKTNPKANDLSRHSAQTRSQSKGAQRHKVKKKEEGKRTSNIYWDNTKQQRQHDESKERKKEKEK